MTKTDQPNPSSVTPPPTPEELAGAQELLARERQRIQAEFLAAIQAVEARFGMRLQPVCVPHQQADGTVQVEARWTVVQMTLQQLQAMQAASNGNGRTLHAVPPAPDGKPADQKPATKKGGRPAGKIQSGRGPGRPRKKSRG